MSDKLILVAKPRTLEGKKVRSLRAEGLVPANISSGSESTMVSVSAKEFSKLYQNVGDSGLFYISLDGESSPRPALVGEVQYHPVTSYVVHVSFRQVSLKEKVTASVPVVVIGELKVKGAVVVIAHSEIEVEALPLDLPEKFEIDLTVLTEVGQSVSFAQLKYDHSKVTLQVAKEQLDEPVVLIQEVKEEKVEEVVVPVDAATTETAAGSAPVDGAAATPASAGSKTSDKK